MMLSLFVPLTGRVTIGGAVRVSGAVPLKTAVAKASVASAAMVSEMGGAVPVGPFTAALADGELQIEARISGRAAMMKLREGVYHGFRVVGAVADGHLTIDSAALVDTPEALTEKLSKSAIAATVLYSASGLKPSLPLRKSSNSYEAPFGAASGASVQTAPSAARLPGRAPLRLEVGTGRREDNAAAVEEIKKALASPAKPQGKNDTGFYKWLQSRQRSDQR